MGMMELKADWGKRPHHTRRPDQNKTSPETAGLGHGNASEAAPKGRAAHRARLDFAQYLQLCFRTGGD